MTSSLPRWRRRCLVISRVMSFARQRWARLQALRRSIGATVEAAEYDRAGMHAEADEAIRRAQAERAVPAAEGDPSEAEIEEAFRGAVIVDALVVIPAEGRIRLRLSLESGDRVSLDLYSIHIEQVCALPGVPLGHA